MSKKISRWGHRLGVLTPATNLTVENELWSMKVDAVTISTSRIKIDAMDWSHPNGIQHFVEGVAARLPETAKRFQFQADSLLLGISSSSLWGGVEGNAKIKAHMKEVTGLDMITPADGVMAALKLLGIKKVGVVTPFPTLADKRVSKFFNEFNVDVLAQKGLRASNPIDIGEFSDRILMGAIEEVNVPGVEAIVQLGTDLPMGRVAPIAEKWLNKPVLSINAITWWHFLRKNGFNDKIKDWGELLEKN